MDDTALEYRDLTCRFGRRVVLDGISLKVPRGSRLCIFGASGCGKTTLLKLTAGLLRPDAGSILLNGRDANSAPPHCRDVGFVFQSELALFPHLSVRDNVAYPLARGRRLAGGADPSRLVNDMLAKVQLAPYADHRIYQLSGGLKQRVAIARALVYSPSILLLDEPLSSLDNRLKIDILELLLDLHAQQSVTVLYVTHDEREALHFSTHIAVIHAGRLEQCGTTAEVFISPKNEKVRDVLGLSRPWKQLP